MTYAVVSNHYNEDMSWVNNVKDVPVYVYSKTSDGFHGRILHNVGSDHPAYLRFITEHYDDLPDKIMCVHGHKESYHQDFPIDAIINRVNWEYSDYFNVNVRGYYVMVDHPTFDPEYMGWKWIEQAFFDFLGKYMEFPTSLGFYACCQFVVDKNLILKYPKKFYEDCEEWMLNTTLPVYAHARVFEYLWHYIFTGKMIEPQYGYDFLVNV